MNIKDRKIEIVGYPENIDPEKIARYIDVNYKSYSYAFCMHTSDIKPDGTQKPVHYHFIIWNDRQISIDRMLKDLDIPERWTQKVRNKKNAIRYLIHLDQPEKYQYNRNEIQTNDIRFVNECLDEISYKDNGYIIDEKFDKSYNQQHSEIFNLQIDQTKKMKLFELLDKFFNHYCIETNTSGAHRNMEIYYIQGETGSGKTTFAKQMCEKLGYDYCVSSSSNDPLQDYRGQKALILDDFRTDNMKFSDLLKLTDPYTNSSVKSRYSNKYMVGCKVIFITSIIPLDKIYVDVAQYEDTKKQFYRRIANVIVCKQVNGIMSACMYMQFNRETGQVYGDYMTIPIKFSQALEYSKSLLISVFEDMTKEEQQQAMQDLPKEMEKINLRQVLFKNDDLPFDDK